MNQMAAVREFDADDLLPGTHLLNGQYQILEPLQKGGFAMTYVARDSLDRNVVIKECFPAGLCIRWNGQVRAISTGLEPQFAALKQQFICEARGMAKLKHPYVVAVHQVFEENNTAYMALDYVEGIDLISVQEDDPQRLNAAFLDATLREALKAVRHIHSKGVLHRDIAPDNLRVDMADRITLIDFGAAGAANPGSAFATASLQAVKDGYSPPEFYESGGVHDFSSDLYSLGATYYFLITGEVPPSGRLRGEAVLAGAPDPHVPLASGNWDCGYPLVLTIDLALELDRTRRPQTADQWLKVLDHAPQQRVAPQAAPLSDRELQAVVSKMVNDVNLNLKAEAPAAAMIEMRGKVPVKPAAEKARPEKWSDIYGNPIIDVASWMIEQEAKSAAMPECDIAPDEPDDNSPVAEAEAPIEIAPQIAAQYAMPIRKSGVFGLISRCLPRRLPRRQQAFPT